MSEIEKANIAAVPQDAQLVLNLTRPTNMILFLNENIGEQLPSTAELFGPYDKVSFHIGYNGIKQRSLHRSRKC
jgi:hypothetical protein